MFWLLVAPALADDCRPAADLCESLKAQASVSRGQEFAAGFEQLRGEFRRQKTTTYADLSQGLVDGAQRLAMGCELARAEQLSCTDWERLKIAAGLMSSASISGSWSIRYRQTSKVPARGQPPEACMDLPSSLAETWVIDQTSGGTLDVRVERQRSLDPLTGGTLGGTFERSTLHVLADSRFGRCSCDLPVKGTQFTGRCGCTSVFRREEMCDYAFSATGMKIGD